MNEVRVIPQAEPMPEREPVTVGRRKGPAGAWQVLHRGKWVSERAVKAHEELELAGGDRERAAVALGIEKEQLRGVLKVYDDAFPDSALPKPARKPLVKPSPKAYYAPTPKARPPAAPPADAAPGDEPPWPVEPPLESVAVITEPQTTNHAVREVAWRPPAGEPLSHQAYRHGYHVGWMAAALAAAVDSAPMARDLRTRLARLALDPPEPPDLPR
jgi:hypothetical protein